MSGLKNDVREVLLYSNIIYLPSSVISSKSDEMLEFLMRSKRTLHSKMNTIFITLYLTDERSDLREKIFDDPEYHCPLMTITQSWKHSGAYSSWGPVTLLSEPELPCGTLVNETKGREIMMVDLVDLDLIHRADFQNGTILRAIRRCRHMKMNHSGIWERYLEEHYRRYFNTIYAFCPYSVCVYGNPQRMSRCLPQWGT